MKINKQNFLVKPLIKISGMFVISLSLGIFTKILLLTPPLFIKVIFDYAYVYKDLNILFIFALLSFVVGLIVIVFSILNSFLSIYINQSYSKTIYRLLYSKLQKLPLVFYQKYKIGDIIYRISSDLSEIIESIINTIKSSISFILEFVFLLIIAMSINIPLTLIALIGIPIYIVQSRYFSNKLALIKKENKELSSKILSIITERLSNIKIIKLFTRENLEVELFLKKVGSLFKIERKNLITSSLNTFISSLINRIWSLILLFYTGYLVINQKLTIGEAVAINSYIAILPNPINKLSELYIQFKTSIISYNRIKEILNFPAEAEEKNNGTKSIKIKGNVEFQNVTFSYIPLKGVLNNLSFTLEKNSSLAIVGRSGIGKTSIADLILKFYKPQGGKILIDGVDIQKINTTSLREQIALIPQDVSVFSGTIKENLTFFVKAHLSEKKIIEACKTADIYNFIMSLPQKFETLVSEGGKNLSGGQKQRIAIARGLLMNPKILILDEATSALDPESEKYIERTIEKLKETKTIIIIAHRLSSVKNVDEILVFGESGQIEEKGNYLSLMQKRGLFFKLHEFQFGGFSQFIRNVYLLFKTASRYDHPFSVACFSLKEIKLLQRAMHPNALTKFLEELALLISLHIREIDICSYQSSTGKIWIAFPETTVQGAIASCKRIEKHIDNTKFPNLATSNITLLWQAKQADKNDNLESLFNKFV